MHLSQDQASRFRPLHDRILVKRFEKKMVGAIFIPEAYRDLSINAEVVAVGPEASGVKPGDVVMLPGYALSHPDWEDGDYAMITLGDIGGIFESQGNA